MRENNHLVRTALGCGEVIPVPNLDKRYIDGLPKKYHQT